LAEGAQLEGLPLLTGRLTGDREMQLFLIGYIIISICEIFTIGGFPLNNSVRLVRSLSDRVAAKLTLRQAFVAVHIAAIVATTWILMLNGLIGYQLLDDGTPISIGLLLISAIILFVGTGYIALDTGFSWTGYWDDTLPLPNRAYALYTLYQLVPLVFLFIFFCLESFLVLRVLGERKPMRTSFASNPKIKANDLQSISSAQLSSSPSDRSSNTLSAFTSAQAPAARSTAVSLRLFSHSSPL
jgi:hypothetical protein